MTFPQNWQELYSIFANPLTFGVLISMILAQFKFMARDSTWKNGKPVQDWFKMLVVLASCLLWSIIVAVANPAGFVFTKDSAYSILLLAFTVAFSSQIWHTVVSPFVQAVISILFGTGQLLLEHARAMRNTKTVRGVPIS